MEYLFQTALSCRTHLANEIEKADEEKLNELPTGFQSTIRWHVAHLVATQTFLTYGLAKQPSPLLSVEFMESAKRGTTQENFSVNEDYSSRHLIEFLTETTKQLQRDFKSLKKHKFTAYECSTGLVLRDIETALAFSNIHDGMHFGQIRVMLRLLG